MMKHSGWAMRRFVLFLASFLSIVFVLWLSGIENVWQRLVGFPPWALAGIIFLLVTNLFLVSFRFWRVLSHFGIILPWRVASRACVAGHAAGLVVISLIGQVMGRQSVMQQFGVQPVVNSSLAAYERVLLASISGVLGVLGGSYLLGDAVMSAFFRHLPIGEVFFAVLGGVVVSLWLGRSRFEAALSKQVFTQANILRVVVIAALTLLGQVMMLGSFVLGILAFNPQLSLVSVFAAAAVISFAASIPVTVNGWGVRELSAVYVLGILGVPAADAVAVSVIIGVCSTLVILAAVPFSLRKIGVPGSKRAHHVTLHSTTEIEKAAAWILAMIVAVTVFFQVHLILPGGAINLNLADPFAILALAALALHATYARQMPTWRIRQFNYALAAIGLLLLFGFGRGAMEVGVTQWALGGRLLGWLVLLGYLSAGYLIVACAGFHGLRRLVETLAATGAVVVVIQFTLRMLESRGVNLGLELTPNFEGYAGNRNAFAFQLLAVTALLLGYSRLCARYSSAPDRSSRSWGYSVLLAVTIAGVAWTGSRSGMFAGVVMLAVAGFGRLAERQIVARSLVISALIWTGAWLGSQHLPSPQGAPSVVHSGNSSQSPVAQNLPIVPVEEGMGAPVQSAISSEWSNQERRLTMVHALELWKQAPLLGVGLGVFIAKSPAWFGYPQVVHSTPLWLLAEFGVLGIVVMGWAFYLLARHAVTSGKSRPAGRGLLLLLLAFGIFCLAHEIFYQRIFWFVLGAVLARPLFIRGRA